MQEKHLSPAAPVVEAEILDENRQPVGTEPSDHARPKGDMGGILSGFFVLAFGFFVTIVVALFTLVVIVPLMLLGRIFGFQVRTFKR